MSGTSRVREERTTMARIVDEEGIKKNVADHLERELGKLERRVQFDGYTPSGRPRSSPFYFLNIMNSTLGKTKTVKGQTVGEVVLKATEELKKWAEQEVRTLVSRANTDAKDRVKTETDESSDRAAQQLNDLRGILAATLDVDDRIDWKSLEDHRSPPPFEFRDAPKPPKVPAEIPKPNKPFFSFMVPALKRKWEAQCKSVDEENRRKLAETEQKYLRDTENWKAKRQQAKAKYDEEIAKFQAAQSERNAAVEKFKGRFEAGDPDAIVEYVNAVFERSTYPEDFDREYVVAYDKSSQTIVVNVSLPPQDAIPDVVEYKYVAKSNEMKPVTMKKKEHDELYDDVIKQVVLRTIHEVFEAVYTKHVMNVVVNGWVTYVDKASGNDQISCIISVSADREQFEPINLSRIDHSECIKSLKGLIAGPLSQVAPVKPIMQLDTKDSRFVEARAVLAEVNASTNLAEIPWEDFEHLVRDLFEEMFAGEGVEVHVTQASRDQGVDAVVFDPDPIRGGKYVIQAKRYTKTVGVGAVRELYGTMINEGAVKGILVTTATYGRDSRQFVKDKPITLIDGSNLVYLLEQHGHKVRIDVEAARAAR
jgi:restriction system protein